MSEIITLDNGFTILLDPVPHVERASMGIWCRAGSRYETPDESGLSHFLEHMFFRGSQKFTNEQINEIPDSLGVDINAYTSKESVAYHCTGLKEAVPQMIDVLTDMVFHPTFPPDLLEIERGAVLTEQGIYYNDPGDHVRTLGDEAVYGADQSLGQPILGPKKNVQTFQRDDLIRFKEKLYTAPNMVFAISGNFDRDAVIAQVSKAAAHLKPGLKNAFAAASVRGGEVIEGRPISQINIRLGCESSPDQTREAMAETLYASIMGSGMSSRLFREIREKRGLVYGIGAGAGAMSGVGNFVIAAALDADKIDEFMMALTQQIKGSRGTITEAERQKALISFKNNYVSALEKIGSRARSLSTMFLSGQTPDLMKEYAELETITLDEINAASQRLFTKGLSLAAIGPQDKLPTLAEFTKDLS